MGLTTTVGLSSSGLKVSQNATALVAANIAGASSDGYTAKSQASWGIYTEGGLVGLKTSVTRAFDQEIFDQLATSTATSSYLDTKSSYVDQIDQLVGSTSSGAALPTALATFSADLETLASQPAVAATRIEVVNSATVVAQTLNSLASTVSDVATAVDGDIAQAVDTVNTTTDLISSLNAQIVSYKGQGADTTGLEDQRDRAVLELSSLLDVQVKPQGDGSIRVSTTSGLTLVDNARATKLAVDNRGELKVDDGSGKGADVIASGMLSSGKIVALYEVRNSILPQVQNQFDQIAAQLASALSDVTTDGTAVTAGSRAGRSIDVGDLENGNSLALTVADTATGTERKITFVKVSDAAALPLADDATLDPNDTVVGIDFSAGTASVASQIQTALGSGYAVTTTGGTTIRILDDGASGTTDVVGLTKTVTMTDAKSGNGAVALFTDGSAVYTGSRDAGAQIDGLAARLRVNADIAADPSLLVTYDASTEASDTTRPDHLVTALNDGQTWFSLGGGQTASRSTLATFANSMVSYWGANATTQKTLVSNQSVIQTNLQSRMSDVSSVSTDDELAKLIQLQTYYSANAQVLSTVRDMLNTLLSAI